MKQRKFENCWWKCLFCNISGMMKQRKFENCWWKCLFCNISGMVGRIVVKI
ncbi:unnamed protein product, partial [Schistosoma bovis]